jgi:hypothetical protein
MATRKKKRTPRPPMVDAAIPNNVFLGVPWQNVRSKYETITKSFRKTYPLTFVIIGREGNQDAEDLFEVIKKRILSSSYAIFDATGGNANVSLEYGFAEANDVPRALYLSTHKAAARASRDSAIIADLAGKTQNRYAQEGRLKTLLAHFARNHPYTKRVDQFLSSSLSKKWKSGKKRARTLCLKIVHALGAEGKARRTDVVQRLLADVSRYEREEIDDMIRRLHNAGLVDSLQGPYSTVTIT